MIVHTTCTHCGQLLDPTTVYQRTHTDCPPPAGPIDRLEAAFLAAVLAQDSGRAAELGLALDSAADTREDLLAAAVAYARSAWPVFPCVAGGKTPATPHGFHDATTDPARVERWWTRHPDHNIGVPTGLTFDCIDVDYIGQPGALDWWLALKEKPDFEIDALAITPRGLHAYVLPTGAGPNSKLGAISGVDYRGIGGYIVVPPSVRDDGTYRFMVVPSPRIKTM